MKIGLLFSGQGAQQVGMGKSLYDNSAVARALYDEAEKTLGWEFKKICFEGPAETLTETRVCQPALYVQGYALYAILKEAGKLSGLTAVAGLSLGELTALAVAGVFDFSTGLRLVAERGRLMQEACDATAGGMAAVIGADEAQVKKICAESDVDMANLNCPGQIVISGEKSKIEKACEIAKAMGIKRAVPLVVAGAYHSRLMEPARVKFAAFMKNIEFKKPQLLAFTNTTGKQVFDPAEIKLALEKQVVSPVLFEQNLRNAAALGIDQFYECGSGNVLAGFAKRIDPNIKVITYNEYADLGL